MTQALFVALYISNDIRRRNLLRKKTILITFVILVDIIFAIASIYWIVNLSKAMLHTSENDVILTYVEYLIKDLFGLIFQVIATVMVIQYSRMHIEGITIDGHILPPLMLITGQNN